MKKIVLVSAFVGAALASHAQFSIGPKVGFGMANAKTSGGTGSDDSKANIAPTLGVEAKIQFSDYFSIQPALQVQVLGEKNDLPSYKIRTYLGYLQLPVKLNAQYQVNESFSVGLGVGPYVGWFLGGGVNTPDDKDDKGYQVKGKSDVKASDYSKDKNVAYIKPLDFGLVIAPFFQVGVLNVAPTIGLGLSNTTPKFEGKTLDAKTKNIYYGLQIAFLFGGKK